MIERRAKPNWLLMALTSLCLALLAIPVAYVGCYLFRTWREPNRFGGTVVMFHSEAERDVFSPARGVEAWLFGDENRGTGYPLPTRFAP